MTPEQRADAVRVQMAFWSPIKPGVDVGRLIADAIRAATVDAVAAERERLIGIVREHRPATSIAWYHPWHQIDEILIAMGDTPPPTPPE